MCGPRPARHEQSSAALRVPLSCNRSARRARRRILAASCTRTNRSRQPPLAGAQRSPALPPQNRLRTLTTKAKKPCFSSLILLGLRTGSVPRAAFGLRPPARMHHNVGKNIRKKVQNPSAKVNVFLYSKSRPSPPKLLILLKKATRNDRGTQSAPSGSEAS